MNIKKIKRTDEMPKQAKWLVMNSNGVCSINTGSSRPIRNMDCSWRSDVPYSWAKHAEMNNYCKNWKKSLRKITDKPSRKELHAEIAKLNRIINANPILIKTRNDYSTKDNHYLKIAYDEIEKLNIKIETMAKDKSEDLEVHDNYRKSYEQMMEIMKVAGYTDIDNLRKENKRLKVLLEDKIKYCDSQQDLLMKERGKFIIIKAKNEEFLNKIKKVEDYIRSIFK